MLVQRPLSKFLVYFNDMKESKAYGNIEIYAPDGTLMFLTNSHKLAFYQRKGLVRQIGENKHQFLFEPKGKGHGERNIQLLNARENRCVVCGADDLDDLTRHHVIPTRFRKYMPMSLKSNNHRYVVFLCNGCHNDYGVAENEFNDELARRYGVKDLRECVSGIIRDKRIIAGIASTLLFALSVPEERKEELRREFKEVTGMEPIEDNLVKTFSKRYEPVTDENNFGKIVVDKVKNLYEFQQMWLEHFNSVMKPRFLPNDLQILLGQ